MLIRSVKALILGTALLVTSAAPAFAQGSEGVGNIAVGLSFLGDEGGTGVQAAVSNRIKALANDKVLSWLVDASYHHNSVLGFSWSSLLLQGGAQVGGSMNGQLDWFAHFMIGIWRASGDLGGFGDFCDALDIDCGASDTSIVFTPGAGVAYRLNEKLSAFAQLDLPISDGNTTRFTMGVRMRR